MDDRTAAHPHIARDDFRLRLRPGQGGYLAAGHILLAVQAGLRRAGHNNPVLQHPEHRVHPPLFTDGVLRVGRPAVLPDSRHRDYQHKRGRTRPADRRDAGLHLRGHKGCHGDVPRLGHRLLQERLVQAAESPRRTLPLPRVPRQAGGQEDNVHIPAHHPGGRGNVQGGHLEHAVHGTDNVPDSPYRRHAEKRDIRGPRDRLLPHRAGRRDILRLRREGVLEGGHRHKQAHHAQGIRGNRGRESAPGRGTSGAATTWRPSTRYDSRRAQR